MYQTSTNTPEQQQQPSSDFIADLKKWWETCPLFTRFLIYACTTVSILSLVSNLATMLVNKPSQVIGQLQIARLIFSPFVFYSIIQTLFAFITYLPVSAQQERENGTLRAFLDFMFKNIEINIIFVLMCYLLSSFGDRFLSLEAYGLWSIFFIQIVERCFLYPEDTTVFLFPSFRLPNKIYPFVLIVIFTIVTNALRMDMVAAGIAAFVNLRFLNVTYPEMLSQERMTAWESSSMIEWFKTMPNFVSLKDTTGLSGPLLADQDREYSQNYAPIGNTTQKRNSSPNIFGNDDEDDSPKSKPKPNKQTAQYEKPQIEI